MTAPHNPPRPRLVRAEGIHVWDSGGRRYLDATSGAFCMQLGYTRPDLVAAMAEAASSLPYARPSRFDSEAAASYRDELLRAAGAPYAQVWLASSGSEAVDLAVRISWWWQRARGASERTEVRSLAGHYHGATLGALDVTGLQERRARFEPLLGPREFGPPAHCARCFRGLQHPACSLACADTALDGAPRSAAFLAETVPAAGLAAAVPPEGWVARVRERCDESGVLWIADEVLTGFGRTGSLFAASRLAERDRNTSLPDLIVFGKGASAGFYPMSGVLVAEHVAAALDDFRHAQTFGGSPIGAAVALRALQAYRTEGWFDRTGTLEADAAKVLGELKESPAVLEVRGMGLLWGIELAPEGAAAHTPGLALAIEKGCRTRGVLVHSSSGFTTEGQGEAILVAPPLSVDVSDLERIADALRQSIEEAVPRASSRSWIDEWEDR